MLLALGLAALTFGLSGYIYHQTGTLEMSELGGLAKKLRFIGVAFVMAAMAGCGLPGFLNFVGEVSVFIGAWQVPALRIVTVLAVFQHANLRTPRWLGWFVQRPESHRIHHARGVHARNYADLPLWDWVFGTLDNPRDMPRSPAQGFYDGASARLLDMLLFRDVSRPRARR